jgi:ABC-type glutathione transport system ATPase component
VVYITHDPQGFAGLADRVLEMRAGRAVPCEDPSVHVHVHDPARLESQGGAGQ